jgi:hypothetical protein
MRLPHPLYYEHQSSTVHLPLFHPLNNPTQTKNKTNSVALVRKQTILSERSPPVGEVSANFSG